MELTAPTYQAAELGVHVDGLDQVLAVVEDPVSDVDDVGVGKENIWARWKAVMRPAG